MSPRQPVPAQRGANAANQKRVDKSRELSNTVAETINGLQEIHAHGAHRMEARKFLSAIKDLQEIRVTWNLFRFGIKASTNFFNNLSPFFIFILGGYLSINGHLDLGALVAFISAQEKIFNPWKEMIDFYQDYQDSSVSYYRTMGYFDALSEHRFDPSNRPPLQLENRIEVDNLSLTTDGGLQLLDNVTLQAEPGRTMALVGPSGSGKSSLVHCISQLTSYSGGSVRLGGEEVSELTKADVAHNLGFVSQSPYIFNGTLRENLLYACNAEINFEEEGGAPTLPKFDDMIEVIQQTGMFADVLRFGLNATLNAECHQNLVPHILKIRKKFQRLSSGEIGDHLEFFIKERYLYYSSIASNITFGVAQHQSFKERSLLDNEFFNRFLIDSGLYGILLDLGAKICCRTMDIFGTILPDEFFPEEVPFESAEFEHIRRLAERLGESLPTDLTSAEQRKLLQLALRFVPKRHKMVGMPRPLIRLILRQRPLFKKKISEEQAGAFTFFHKHVYLQSLSILDNVLFGHLKNNRPRVDELITERIVQLLIEQGVLEDVLAIGLQFHVGSRGERLSGGQRQKLAIARVLLKKPKVLILDEVTSALDNKSQARIQGLLESRWKGRVTVISVVHRLDTVKNYDKILVLRSGQVCESGTYSELMGNRGLFFDLAVSGLATKH